MKRNVVSLVLIGIATIALAWPAWSIDPPEFVLEWSTGDRPTGIGVDASGNVYVAAAGNNRILKFTSDGTFLLQWGTAGTGDGQFNWPPSAIPDASGNVFVSDGYNHRVQKFTSDGTYILQWGTEGTGDGQFYIPNGVFVDPSGDVYVTCGFHSTPPPTRIQKFTSDGTFLLKWGSHGSGDGQFYNPTGLAMDSEWNIYVADFRNERIQKFTHDGTFILKWGTRGTGDGQFNRPIDVAVDACDNVYVADALNHRIQVFSTDGTFLTKWGSYGTGEGQFFQPWDVAVDACGNIFVADHVNCRIQKFAFVCPGPPPIPDVEPLPDLVGECSVTITTPPTATDCQGNTVTGATADPLDYPDQGSYIVHWTYTDAVGNSPYQDQTVIVKDVTPPEITCPEDLVQLVDPNACEAVVSYTPTANDNCAVVSITATPPPGTVFPIGTTTVTCKATDVGGNSSTCQFNVTVYNPEPEVTINGPPSGAIYAAGTPVNFAGSFTDNTGDTHTAEWICGGTVIEGNIDEETGSVSLTHTFETAGVYFIQLTVTDQCGGTDTATTIDGLDALVVVYDPSAGFVTGGGWINSPEGAYSPDTTITGKANFGFVSKYQKGATTPTGQTEFRFKVADLNFHSTSYDWLVIAGAKAMYKGSGTINGTGDYGVMLSAVDGEINGGGDADKFRIKIKDKALDQVIYDNQMDATDTDDPVTTLGGGSIVIHKSKDKGAATTALDDTGRSDKDESPPATHSLLQNWPNPFNPTTRIPFELPVSGQVNLAVYNVSGRLVKQLVNSWMPAGRHSVTWDGRNRDGQSVASGIYFYCIKTGNFIATKRMVLLK